MSLLLWPFNFLYESSLMINSMVAQSRENTNFRIFFRIFRISLPQALNPIKIIHRIVV